MARFTTRSTCEECPTIDVRYLKRRGMLRPGHVGTLSSWRGDQKTGSIGVAAHVDQIQLRYKCRDESIRQHIHLDSTPCYLGRERMWFLCPWCWRRCAILYGPGKEFACRHCYRLNYESQRNNGRYTAMHKMQALRRKLGGSANLSEPFPPRPKGMHHNTYERLQAKDERYERAQVAMFDRWLRSI